MNASQPAESFYHDRLADMHRHDRYLNRELSWLAFNYRVLEEASNPQIPLLERVKFLSICASNLDEFYMVRVAGLKDQLRHDDTRYSADGLSTTQQLDAIHIVAGQLINDQQRTWMELEAALEQQAIEVLRADELQEEDRRWMRRYFNANIFPVLTPIAVDPAHPFPFIPNLGMACLFALHEKGSKKRHMALVPLSAQLSRFVAIRPSEEGPHRFMRIEEVISLCFDTLFPGFVAGDRTLFRVIRDSDIDIEEEAEDLVRTYERAVKERRRGRVIRVKYAKGTSESLQQFLIESLHVEPGDMFEVEGMIGVASLGELYQVPRPDLKFSPFNVRFPERINDYDGNCFAAIQAKDIVVHHPYESFDVVIRFLEQAARDPDVVSIKQTLYRTSHDSPIVRALIEAAEHGKSVTALVELKARFDEEANIRWARDMERAGVQVVYGFVDMKTHAKMSLVVRREGGKLRSYAHFGTGNYHPNTAKVYTDLSFFTCDPTLCRDASYVFNYITGYAKPQKLKKIAVSPVHLRRELYEQIEAEIAHAKAGRPAAIWAKMNSLIDVDIIEKLYEASCAGVEIDLIVRGICGLRPGVSGMSETIRVKSIVGRFLEHARIYCFGNGKAMPSSHAHVYLSSADWMTRNMDHRVEVMVPIENPTVHEQILGQIMMANLKDTRQSWELKADGSYHRVPEDSTPLSAHDYFMQNPSLSGRGKALHQNTKPKRTPAKPRSKTV